ncbi:hypothetical protein KEM48_002478 [Puccinia striiformis f. sp. tritici PST-130]|nr:hypothetical protein KEM48_002478 [Puccinia striiformis f. sp. tritici PST-130]
MIQGKDPFLSTGSGVGREPSVVCKVDVSSFICFCINVDCYISSSTTSRLTQTIPHFQQVRTPALSLCDFHQPLFINSSSSTAIFRNVRHSNPQPPRHSIGAFRAAFPCEYKLSSLLKLIGIFLTCLQQSEPETTKGSQYGFVSTLSYFQCAGYGGNKADAFEVVLKTNTLLTHTLEVGFIYSLTGKLIAMNDGTLPIITYFENSLVKVCEAGDNQPDFKSKTTAIGLGHVSKREEVVGSEEDGGTRLEVEVVHHDWDAQGKRKQASDNEDESEVESDLDKLDSMEIEVEETQKSKSTRGSPRKSILQAAAKRMKRL